MTSQKKAQVGGELKGESVKEECSVQEEETPRKQVWCGCELLKMRSGKRGGCRGEHIEF